MINVNSSNTSGGYTQKFDQYVVTRITALIF